MLYSTRHNNLLDISFEVTDMESLTAISKSSVADTSRPGSVLHAFREYDYSTKGQVNYFKTQRFFSFK